MSPSHITTALEAAGIVLVIAAFATVAIVCGTWSWEIGALVAAFEAAAIGVVLVLLATARERRA